MNETCKNETCKLNEVTQERLSFLKYVTNSSEEFIISQAIKMLFNDIRNTSKERFERITK